MAERQRQQQHDQHERRCRVQQQLARGGRLRRRGAAVAQVDARRQLHLRGDRRARRARVAGLIGGRAALRPRPGGAGRPRASIRLRAGDHVERRRPPTAAPARRRGRAAAARRRPAGVAPAPAMRIDDRHAAVGLVELRDAAAVVGGVDRSEHVARPAGRRAPAARVAAARCSSGWRGGTTRRTVPLSGHLPQQRGDLAGDLVVDVEVGAEHADEERRAFARQRLADALGEHRVDLDQLVRVIVEDVADRASSLRGGDAAARVDLDLELALVRRVRILAVLGAADLLGDALHAGNRRQARGDALRRRARFPRARCRAAARRARSDSSRGNPAAGARRAAAAAPARRRRSAARRPAPARVPRSRRSIARRCQRLQRAQQRGLRRAAGSRCMTSAHSAGVALMATSSDRPTASRNAIGERAEERALQARHHQDRQERDRDRGGGIEHRPPHFERGARAAARASSEPAPARAAAAQ